MSDITIEHVSKSYAGRPPVRALDGVDLTIAHGSIVAVLGRSGCGKTTLLRTIAGFERPDAGTIWFGRDEVASNRRMVAPERRRVGIVPQEGALFPHLDVAANVAFALRNRRGRESRDRVGQLLESVGLAGHERRRPHELSGGQQQRVALARALASHPAILLLDEPFTALDINLRAQLRADVVAIVRNEGATAMIVSHDPAEAMSMADTVAVMRAGRLVQTGSGEELYRRPVDHETAVMLGEVTEISGHGNGHRATTPLGDIDIDIDVYGSVAGPLRLVFRPEQIVFDESARANGVITGIQFHGSDVVVTVRLGPDSVRARWPIGDGRPHRERWLVGDAVGVRAAGRPVLVRKDRRDH